MTSSQSSRLKIANLTPEELSKVQALEDSFGMPVLAFEREHRLASLSEEQIARLQALEAELGVFLLAYKKSP